MKVVHNNLGLMVLAISAMCFLATLTTADLVAVSEPMIHNLDDSALKAEFEKFKVLFEKHYASSDEETLRFQHFVTNMNRLAHLRRAEKQQVMSRGTSSSMDKMSSSSFGLTPFFDLSEAEFDSQYLQGGRAFFTAKLQEREEERLLRDDDDDEEVDVDFITRESFLQMQQADEAFLYRTAVNRSSAGQLYAPPAWDWRDHGAVTKVKNQGKCGSCWAFSAIGNIEGQWAISGHSLVDLSTQQLTSCDTVDMACEGGIMEQAFDWLVVNNSGVVYTEESYPYVSGDTNVPACGANVNPLPGAKISGFVTLAEDEELIEAWLAANGPLAIAVDATVWSFYTGGVLPFCLPFQLNHGVLLVGYDNTAETPYWIIKNSWGPSWGENGYIRIRKGTNECKMKEYVVSAYVGDSPPPSPVPPKPTSTKPPGPQPPASGQFSQKTCITSDCSSLCTTTRAMPVGQCVTISSGSMMVTCGETVAEQTAYETSDCSGPSRTASFPLNVCTPSWMFYQQSICS